MGFLTQLLQPQLRANADPNNEAVWTTASSLGGYAASGVYVDSKTALQASPVWACTRLLAESIASMPIIVYRRLSGGGKERASDHPIYELLHDAPNSLQTAFQFKRTLMVHALLWGNGYARIYPGVRGAVDRLELLHPDNVRVETIPGGVRYQVKGDDGREVPVNDEDIFQLPGLSVDGINGLGLMKYARESIGLALAAEQYSARVFSQGSRPGGLLKSPKVLTDAAAKRLKESWQAAHSGLGHAHQVAVLEEGVEWEATSMTNEEAQLIAQLDWSAADIARFFNVPLHMIQLMTKTTSLGSGIEEMGIQFVTYTLLPWIRNWEDTIRKDLIVANRTYFAEFLLEALLRGKQGDRYTAYATGRQWGWLSVNDIRRLENMNPVPDGDVYLQPMNMAPAGTLPEPEPASAEALEMEGHYELLLQEAAARVVRKEIAAMTKAAKRTEGDAEAWERAVVDFYCTHADFVERTLHISSEAAIHYVADQMDALFQAGLDVMADWETRRVADLIALAREASDGK